MKTFIAIAALTLSATANAQDYSIYQPMPLYDYQQSETNRLLREQNRILEQQNWQMRGDAFDRRMQENYDATYEPRYPNGDWLIEKQRRVLGR